MNDVVKEEIKALYKEGNEILNGFKDNTDKHVNLRRKYQIWYTKSLIVVKEVLPDRHNEFVECYTCSKRKEISYSNFSMYDFLIGISVSRGGVSLFDPKIAGLVRFATQIDIIKSICDNMYNVLFDIKSNIEFEILDNELTSSRKLLKKGFIRSAGAICGVVLEKHFSTVLTNHNLKFSKKEPVISDFNDLLNFDIEESKEDFLIDVMPFANSHANGSKYIITGVKLNKDNSRKLRGINEQKIKDGADYQSLVNDNIEPNIIIDFKVIDYDGNKFGIFKIGSENNDKPYLLSKQYGKLQKEYTRIRKGQKTNMYQEEILIYFIKKKIMMSIVV